MIIVFYRGYFGFQPLRPSSEIPYSLTEPNIISYIHDGALHMPVSDDDLDKRDLMDMKTFAPPYLVSRQLYYRFLLWDEHGPSDNVFVKEFKREPGSYPSFRRFPLNKKYSKSAILTQAMVDGDYLAALIHAEATLAQINSFCVEYLLGSGRPFVWTPVQQVHDLIILSKNKESSPLWCKVNDNPPRHVFLKEAEDILRQVEQARQKKTTSSLKTNSRKPVVKKIKKINN